MRETRVNLKHLLEDIRDSYAIPLEEVILVELVANALDSGASRIDFFTNTKNNSLVLIDNGKGMRREAMSDYHNIAATTKKRGQGIGFAGVGAKLSLLVASSVRTETKGGYGTRCATEWYLKDETSAPWKFVPFSGKVPYSRGTAVSINLQNSDYPLLHEDFVASSVYSHFYPLFQSEYFETILKHVYKKGVDFFLNNKKISAPKPPFKPRVFQIRLSSRGRPLVGCGYLGRLPENENAWPRFLIPGLAVSTFGKIIKSGWEWIGLEPQDKNQIQGFVEIPALAEILTTNKMDFLKTAGALKKYYRYRRAVQEVLMPILADLGEAADLSVGKKGLSSLARDIERTLKNIVLNFPELVPLLGIQKAFTKEQGALSASDVKLVGITEKTKEQIENEEKQTSLEKQERSSDKAGDGSVSKSKTGKKDPALTIGFENRSPSHSLARMVENKIWINTSHPAYFRAKQKKQEQYHIVFSVAWALSAFLDSARSPQSFINDFLASWGRGDKRTASLLKG